MNNLLIRTLKWSSVSSVGITLSHLIPFNLPVLLLFIPVAQVFPSLRETGEAVEYGFLWLEIKQLWVWGVLLVWHWIVVFPVVLAVLAIKQKRAEKPRGSASR